MVVLDISHYDLPTLNPRCFRESGVTGVICATYSPVDAPHQMRRAAQSLLDEGISILGFYGFIYFGSPYGEVRDVQWAIQLAQEFEVRRVWLDCETDGVDNGFTDAYRPQPWERVRAIHSAVEAVEAAGLEPGVYTGSWWWPRGTGNSTDFAHLPLWNSYYDQDPDIDGLPYGGWTTAAVEQYSSTIPICGRNRDHNKVYELEDDPMTADERALLLKMASVAAGNLDGSEFPDVASALARFTELEDGDTRILAGLAATQAQLGTHFHEGFGEGYHPEFPG